jgi:replicative DNA helicase
LTDRELTSAEVRAKADAITAAILAKRPAPGQQQPQAPSQPVPVEPDYVTPEWETWWLPEPVGAWVDACHVAYGVPKVMAIAAALCAACTVTQGAVEVEVKPGWREPLSLYWLVFSPTGSRKSALLKAATAPVRAIQEARKREIEPEKRKRENEKARLEQQIQRMRRAVKAHKYTEGAQEHMQQLRELEHEHATIEIPLPPRWLYDDINPTLVPRMMAYSHDAEGIARMAVLDAEGTFLANLLGRHSGHVNVDPLLKGYMGEPIDMVRAVHGSRETQNIHLDAAHLTLLLLIQPHYLDQIRSKPELGTNGLIGRCLMSHCEHSPKELDWDAPAVPQNVQEGYARWLATLAALEPGTVWQMPAECHPDLKRIHQQLERDRISSGAAVGFTVRTLGRICRIIALTELSELSDRQRPSGGAARTRVISKLTYLHTLCYSHPLAHQRLVEPPTHPLARMASRALRWLRQLSDSSDSSLSAGKRESGFLTVDLRQLQRALTIKKDEALTVADSLVESGHLEQLAPVVRANKTLAVRYKVISTEAEPSEPKPAPFLASLPTGAELERELPPPLADYIGDEFEGESP